MDWTFLPETPKFQQDAPAPRPIGRPKRDPSEPAKVRKAPETVPVAKKTRACAACERNGQACTGYRPCSSCQKTNQICSYDWVPSYMYALADVKAVRARTTDLLSILPTPSKPHPSWSPTNLPDTPGLSKEDVFHHGLPITGVVHAEMISDSYSRLYRSQPSARWTANDLALDRAIVYATMSIGSYNSLENRKDWNDVSRSVQYCNQARDELEKTTEGTDKSLHARILITQCLLDHFRIHDAWDLFGTVRRHARAIQQALETGSSLSPKAIAHRKDLLRIISIYDGILRSILARPGAMRDEESDQEEWDLSEVRKNPSIHEISLCYESKLAELIGWIMRVVYSPQREENVSDLRETSKWIEKKLQKLENDVELHLKSTGFLSLKHVHLANGRKLILTLTYCHAYLLLYRPFLRPVTSESDSEWAMHCRDQSIGRAETIIERCAELHTQEKFSRRSWLVSHVHFAATETLYECFILRPEDKPRKIADRALRRYTTDKKADVVDRPYIEKLWELQKETMRLANRHDAAVAKTPTDPSALMTGIFDFDDPFGTQFTTPY